MCNKTRHPERNGPLSCSITNTNLCATDAAPVSPCVLVLVAVKQYPDHDSRKTCKKPMDQLVPLCLREGPGAVKDRNDGLQPLCR